MKNVFNTVAKFADRALDVVTSQIATGAFLLGATAAVVLCPALLPIVAEVGLGLASASVVKISIDAAKKKQQTPTA